MANISISGDTSGAITLSAPAVSGSNVQTLAAVSGTLAPIVSGTAVTASGTSVDFTGIPSWAKRVTVMFSGVSTSGTSAVIFQLSTSGGFVATGYLGSGNRVVNAAATAGATYTTGFGLPVAAGTYDLYGHLTLTNISGNVWVASGNFAITSAIVNLLTSGAISLAAALTAVKVTTVNGTDTFDAGTINILYE